jgi:hypothetical protein
MIDDHLENVWLRSMIQLLMGGLVIDMLHRLGVARISSLARTLESPVGMGVALELLLSFAGRNPSALYSACQ